MRFGQALIPGEPVVGDVVEIFAMLRGRQERPRNSYQVIRYTVKPRYGFMFGERSLLGNLGSHVLN